MRTCDRAPLRNTTETQYLIHKLTNVKSSARWTTYHMHLILTGIGKLELCEMQWNVYVWMGVCVCVCVCERDTELILQTNLPLALVTKQDWSLWTDLKNTSANFLKHYSDSLHLASNSVTTIKTMGHWDFSGTNVVLFLTLYQLSCCCKGSTGLIVHRLKV